MKTYRLVSNGEVFAEADLPNIETAVTWADEWIGESLEMGESIPEDLELIEV